MPIAVTCPGCSAKMKAPDAAAGKKVKCPKCQEPITVPAPIEEADFEVIEDEPAPLPKKPTPKPVAKPKPVVEVDEDEEDVKPKKKPAKVVDEDEDEKPMKKKPKAAVEEDEDEDEKPKKRKTSDEEDEDDRPKKKKKKKAAEGGTSMMRNVIGGVVLLILVAVAAVIFYQKLGKKPEESVSSSSSGDSSNDALSGPIPQRPGPKLPGKEDPVQGVEEKLDFAFKSKEGRFSILLPKKPTEYKGELPDGKEDYRTAVESKDKRYLIVYYDSPALVKEDPDKFLSRLIDAIGLTGTVLSTENITLGTKKYPGREVRLQRVIQKDFSRGRYFLVGERHYQITAVGSEEFVKSKAVGTYLNSFAVDE